VLPGKTPGAVVRSEYPDMLSASSWQSAEYALGEFMTDTLKTTTTHNTRCLRAEGKLIIGSWATLLVRAFRERMNDATEPTPAMAGAAPDA